MLGCKGAHSKPDPNADAKAELGSSNHRGDGADLSLTTPPRNGHKAQGGACSTEGDPRAHCSPYTPSTGLGAWDSPPNSWTDQASVWLKGVLGNHVGALQGEDQQDEKRSQQGRLVTPA